jgi:hypothetical protein
MRAITALVLILTNSYNISAGNETHLEGARASAMGNASVCLKDNWAIGNNQAGLLVKEPTAGIYYSNRYLLKGTDLKGFMVAYPTSKGVFGFSTSMFGGNLFNQKKLGLTYSQSFGNISAGLQFNYLSTHIAEDYGTKGIFNIEGGIQIKVLKNVLIGAHVYNPTRSKLADYNDERESSIYKSGIAWYLSDKVILCSEIEKDLNLSSVFKTGLEYKPIKQLSLRTGFISNSTLASFGFGLNFDHFTIDVASSFHPLLGYSPQFSFSYNF